MNRRTDAQRMIDEEYSSPPPPLPTPFAAPSPAGSQIASIKEWVYN